MNQQRNKVRIIGGEYRRRLLPFPDSSGLRPTPDRVRETVFNWLGQSLHGKRCLDLFAGSGAMGFEAASRGAGRVVMVEKGRAVAEALQANRQLLAATQVDVLCTDALHFLRAARETFDVVFVDPPYDSDLLSEVLPLLAPVLAADAVVYLESRTWPALPGWEVSRRGKAGVVCYGLIAREIAG
ncbi:MAG: 16S rRNA (guanine(966)-N(2))-methyltransferase RsmD [Paludibacterium sp.]|uniref:16S rRNA (guanine(966)-N(2))-methyltransferase RsmD n=1 Tax=Paludibacterium sp. TaxID=1917523 RepID=UPI0025D5A99F|nr:16S rRNA (guanine(966)-N(2))-methyltransferase RsmD [Paludibacterium sp.]MBV8049103.1 16S rRNA (guanine(966)-N(2))-methyltransferase RsmD [Paludibacterium sp.]MBV8648534.1 16S rRNA (guanine(966)-N(2))-methyltransferase RsmD [Paludibacterium sp.]